MGRSFSEITDAMSDFISRQHLFFVATAPSSGGHVNVSPKGYDTLAVLGPTRVAYLDLTGSGAETIAHLCDDGRITLMFCAFSGKPNIVRLYGKGTVLTSADDGFDQWVSNWPQQRGIRSIVVIDIDRTSMSCGYSVPFMEYTGDRQTLTDWVAGKSDADLDSYRATKNAQSIDGLVALRLPT